MSGDRGSSLNDLFTLHLLKKNPFLLRGCLCLSASSASDSSLRQNGGALISSTAFVFVGNLKRGDICHLQIHSFTCSSKKLKTTFKKRRRRRNKQQVFSCRTTNRRRFFGIRALTGAPFELPQCSATISNPQPPPTHHLTAPSQPATVAP